MSDMFCLSNQVTLYTAPTLTVIYQVEIYINGTVLGIKHQYV